jgi:hypothetical protein
MAAASGAAGAHRREAPPARAARADADDVAAWQQVLAAMAVDVPDAERIDLIASLERRR